MVAFHQTALLLAKARTRIDRGLLSGNNVKTGLQGPRHRGVPVLILRYADTVMKSLDRWLVSADNALRTLAGGVHAARPCPGAGNTEALPDADRQRAGALMRVNHVGEVCAQALYQAQALTARTPELRARMQGAARDELDHLAWKMCIRDRCRMPRTPTSARWPAGRIWSAMR